MHRKFRALLDGATGESKLVVVANLDIRGFSNWSKSVDSAETALYIKKVYAILIDDFFPDPAFVTSTGDGLLVVIPYEEADLSKVVRKTVGDCMKIVTQFAKLCNGDPMINFDVPREIGVGIARGSASRIVNDGETLDYSGNVLSLATRLMDLARPNGVVLDESVGSELLTKHVQDKFHRGSAYLKGVSPTTPRKILLWPEALSIPEANRHPVGSEVWKTNSLSTNVAKLTAAQTPLFRLDLTQRPVGDEEGVVLRVIYPQIIGPGRKSDSAKNHMHFPFQLEKVADDNYVTFEKEDLLRDLDSKGIRPGWPFRIEVKYRVL